VGGSKFIASRFGAKLSLIGFRTSFFTAFCPTLDIELVTKSIIL
jgi:hypothetical protein